MTLPDARARISFRRVLTYILLAFIVILPVRVFVAQPFLVSGGSMTPTFSSGDYLVVDELSYRFHPPERGDIIIFRYPLDPDQVFIKRIIALPGETVQIANGRVSVIGRDKRDIVVLDEPYRADGPQKKEVSTTTLHDDEYFVLGDDRDASADSRVWGPLVRHFIIGKAALRLWPLSQITLLPGQHRYETVSR